MLLTSPVGTFTMLECSVSSCVPDLAPLGRAFRVLLVPSVRVKGGLESIGTFADLVWAKSSGGATSMAMELDTAGTLAESEFMMGSKYVSIEIWYTCSQKILVCKNPQRTRIGERGSEKDL